MWEYSTEISAKDLLASDTTSILFKHSNRCSISSMAFKRMLDAKEDFDSVAAFFLLDVVSNRPVSLQLAEDLRVEHASPQVVVIKNGKVVYTASHMDIRSKAILSHL
ncbi:bacillithiol system redox-active protein YtxJ [Bacteroidia bacterium]|nr:bacillithiol system redox-active protein YtxJ [Bacteroidia bacterium]MDB9882435.1 bacillithiol system redox-active protein YtxJ [Bacteroidia bacterium]MDC1395422.1 bacillithiol system redox-active protein YtxJ [Bacteroidia bacterium]